MPMFPFRRFFNKTKKKEKKTQPLEQQIENKGDGKKQFTGLLSWGEGGELQRSRVAYAFFSWCLVFTLVSVILHMKIQRLFQASMAYTYFQKDVFLSVFGSFFKSLFIYFEREREQMCMHVPVGEGQREGERESPAGSVLSVQSPTWGSIS